MFDLFKVRFILLKVVDVDVFLFDVFVNVVFVVFAIDFVFFRFVEWSLGGGYGVCVYVYDIKVKFFVKVKCMFDVRGVYV